MSATLLQLYLLLLMLVIGILATIAFQQAYAHFYPDKGHDSRKGLSDLQGSQGSQKLQGQSTSMPPAIKEQLLRQSQANFQAVLDKSAEDLQHDLDKTAGELNRVLQKIGAEVVGNEMERYRLQLDDIRKQAAGAIGSAQDDIAKHQAELKASLQQEQAQARARLATEISGEKQRVIQEIITEKQQLVQQIDTKLADAMASFLLESLGHNVDLGAQTAYLTAQLEAHKADFKRSVGE